MTKIGHSAPLILAHAGNAAFSWNNGRRPLPRSLDEQLTVNQCYFIHLGSKSSRPARLMAVTSSGEVTKQWVLGLASFLPVKLRL